MTSGEISRRALLRDAAVVGGGAFVLHACTGGGSSGEGSGNGSGLPDIEGGEVITDPSRIPTSFQERPQFAEQVQAGELPPVAERIGQDPLVIQPVHDIGSYGGTIRRGFIGAEDLQNANLFCAGPDNLLYWDFRYENVVPNIARDYEMSSDYRELTLHLRRGMCWSDGEPFTADDIMFWRYDINLNPEVAASGSVSLRIDGKDVEIDKVDDYTVVYRSPVPYAALPELLAGLSDIAGPSYIGSAGGGGFAAAHYLERFHPKFTSEDEANRLARDAGFDTWGLYLLNQNSWYLNPDLPTVTPWIVTRPINDPPWEFTANPYSIWVDTEGNQLPYIDEISMDDFEDTQVLALRAAAGEFDFQDRGLDVKSLPVLVRDQDRSDYTLHQAPSEAVDAAIQLNLAYDNEPEIGDLIRTVEFRRALSLGLDRHQINETFFLGTSVETATVPSDTNDFFLGEEWRTKWATHDVEQANQLLDDIGLTDKDGDGFRLLPSGDRIRLIIESPISKVDFPAVGNNISRQWRQIGIDSTSDIIDGLLMVERILTNDVMVSVNSIVGTEDPSLAPYSYVPAVSAGAANLIGYPYVEWFLSEGASGTEPPESMAGLAEAVELYREGLQKPRDERIELTKQMCELHADQVWTIGLVGSGLSTYGLYVAKNNLGNVPARFNNSSQTKSPTLALPMTFYYT